MEEALLVCDLKGSFNNPANFQTLQGENYFYCLCLKGGLEVGEHAIFSLVTDLVNQERNIFITKKILENYNLMCKI